jgi:hypothetical protein
MSSYPPETPEVQHPQHRLSALTTYELRAYRRELEQAIAFFDRQRPVPPIRADLSARLRAVLAEQDQRGA